MFFFFQSSKLSQAGSRRQPFLFALSGEFLLFSIDLRRPFSTTPVAVLPYVFVCSESPSHAVPLPFPQRSHFSLSRCPHSACNGFSGFVDYPDHTPYNIRSVILPRKDNTDLFSHIVHLPHLNFQSFTINLPCFYSTRKQKRHCQKDSCYPH